VQQYFLKDTFSFLLETDIEIFTNEIIQHIIQNNAKGREGWECVNETRLAKD
jgi:hypothetical protein